ncbi:ty3-gypsy retrotransposon protein [Tanacetum coccineum]
MDEVAVRVLLKDQSDAIKGLGFTRHGVGGDPGLPLSVRLEVPKFNGTDPKCWLFAIHEYFDLMGTSADQRLKVMGFNLEGDAAKWFRWMSRNKLITDWEGFLESVYNRFGPCKYEDPQGALSKLLQLGTVAQYQSDFEKLMNRVMKIPEKLFISICISGLKPSLQRELLVSKPMTLGEAFSLARVMEAQELVKPTLFPIAPKPNSNADNKWVRGHKCPRKFLFLMANEEEDATQDAIVDQDKALKSGDISILNSLVKSGETLLCENICSKVVLKMQGLSMEVDLWTGCCFEHTMASKVGKSNPRLCAADDGVHTCRGHAHTARRCVTSHEADQFA